MATNRAILGSVLEVHPSTEVRPSNQIKYGIPKEASYVGEIVDFIRSDGEDWPVVCLYGSGAWVVGAPLSVVH